jgi:DNA-binding transcriptional ArsR family regulator
MNDPIFLLDQYRVPILSDEFALKILSLLYKQGATTEHELAEALHIDSNSVKRTAFSLGKGGLVGVLQPGEWRLSVYGRQIVEALDINSIATESLVGSLVAAPWQKEALHYCAFQHLRDGVNSPANLSSYRVVDVALRKLHGSKLACDDATALLSSLLIANNVLTRSGARVNQQRWLRFVGDSLATSTDPTAVKYHDEVVGTCKAAFEETARADRVILFLDIPTDENLRSKTYLNVFSRLAQAATGDATDAVLFKAFAKDPTVPDKLWSHIVDWEPMATMAFHDVIQRCRFGPDDSDLAHVSVPHALGFALSAALKQLGVGQLDSWSPKALKGLLRKRRLSKTATIIAAVNGLRQKIEGTDLAALPESDRTLLRAEMDRLSATMLRIMPNPESSQPEHAAQGPSRHTEKRK